MDRLLRLGGGMAGLSQAPPPTDAPAVDTAEQVYISSLALLKMLKHGRAGVPMEVMGLMLGKYAIITFSHTHYCDSYWEVVCYKKMHRYIIILHCHGFQESLWMTTLYE